jgi:hypothetical protein
MVTWAKVAIGWRQCLRRIPSVRPRFRHWPRHARLSELGSLPTVAGISPGPRLCLRKDSTLPAPPTIFLPLCGRSIFLALRGATKGATRRRQRFSTRAWRSRASGDRWAIGFSIYLQNTVAYEVGDLERHAALAEVSLAILREQVERLGLAYALNAIGEIALRRHDETRAASVFKESLAHSRALGNPRGIGFALLGLGVVARRRRDHAAAAAYFVESLAPWRRLGNDRGVAKALEELAETAAAVGAATRAARLSGAASARREAIGMPRSPRLQAAHDRGLAPARLALGESAFAEA